MEGILVSDTEVEAEVAGQKLKVKGSDVNMLFTVSSFIGIVLIGYVIYTHADDAKKSDKEVAIELRDANREVAKVLKDQNKEMTDVLKEMARATREQNCLLSLPQEQRQRNAETCKRISQ